MEDSSNKKITFGLGQEVNEELTDEAKQKIEEKIEETKRLMNISSMS